MVSTKNGFLRRTVVLKVLCVSSGDSSIAPLTKVILRALLGPDFIVESAGSYSRSNLRYKDTLQDSVSLTAIIAMETALEHLPSEERAHIPDLRTHVGRWLKDVSLDDYKYFVCINEFEAGNVRTELKGRSDAVVLIIGQPEG